MSIAEARPADADAIRELLHEHMALFFPDQHPSKEEHQAFGELFGKLEGHPHLKNNEEADKIFELMASRGGLADEWHSDSASRSSRRSWRSCTW